MKEEGAFQLHFQRFYGSINFPVTRKINTIFHDLGFGCVLKRGEVICPKSHSELPAKSGFWPGSSESYSGFLWGQGAQWDGEENHKSSSDPVSFPSEDAQQAVSTEYSRIHDPEGNLARLLNKPSGDLGSSLTKLRCNRKSSEPRELGDLSSHPASAINLSHDPGQLTFPFEPEFPHLDSRSWEVWTTWSNLILHLQRTY